MSMNYLMIALLFLSATMVGQVTKIWETTAELEVPESVKYYEKGKCIFVSNIAGKPSDKDGNGFISRLTVSGEIETLKWVEGLNAPKGIAIKDRYLYVTDIDELVIIDIEKAKIVDKIHQPQASFLNDVTITLTGDVLVSDSGTSAIYVLKDEQLEVWLQNSEWERVNGLFAENDYVLLGTNSNIVKIDLKTKVQEVFVETGGQADGIEADGNGGYYFSFWKGELYYYYPGQAPMQLLNTSESNVQSADIGFNPDSGEVLVPTFFANRVVAYKKN